MKKTFRQTSLSILPRRLLRHGVPAILACFVALISSNHQPAFAQAKPDKDYLVYVLSEAADKISLIRFGPGGVRVDHDVPTGDMPIDIDG